MSQNKQAYKQKVDAQLREWEAKTELLKAKGNNLSADAKLELDKQLQNIEKHKKEFSAYFENLANRTDEKWDDVKDEAENKWKSFAKSVESVISKYT